MSVTDTKEDTNGRVTGEKGTVLVMDDEESIRDVLAAMLQCEGYGVAFATDGAQAVELYREAYEAGDPYSAVIMDLTIPGGMGGKDAITRLVEIDPDVRAIVSSGYSQDPVIARFREYGFKGVLSKPFRLEELEDVLAQVSR